MLNYGEQLFVDIKSRSTQYAGIENACWESCWSTIWFLHNGHS